MPKQPLNTSEMLESADSFEDVYKSYSKSIYKFIFWRTKDPRLAEDLTSSTFEKAWVARSSFRGGSAQAWLYRIARNVLIDHLRKKKELLVDDADTLAIDQRPTTAEVLDKKMMIKRLRSALKKLPEDTRAVVIMRFIDGLSSKQVAKNLDLSESNVRVIQYRALKKLKDYMK